MNRVWRLVYDNLETIAQISAPETDPAARRLRRQTHRTIRKVTEDIDGRFHFNTAIAAVMELVNEIYASEVKQSCPGALREALEAVVRLLAPFVPHIAEELWSQLGHAGGIEAAGWPVLDEAALTEEEKTIVVQVNGKVRGKITVPAGTDDREVELAALAEPNVARFIAGQTVRKVVVVPGRLVSVVIG